MDLSIGGGVKSSRSKGLQSFIAEKFSYFGIGNFPSTVGRGLKIDFSKAKVRFSGERSDLSDSVKSLVSTVEKTAGLPRSQDPLLPRNDMGSKAAFTLAEVLITLGIIGVVAAMTLPALLQNNKEKARITALKKQYSILNQAYQQIVFENGTPDIFLRGCEGRINCQTIMAEKFKEHLSIIKDCGFESGCFKNAAIKNIDGSNHLNYNTKTDEYRLILKDGTGLIFFVDDDGYINIKVDVDGFNGENTWGKDVFIFEVSDNRMLLVPMGSNYPDGYRNSCLENDEGYSKHGYSCTAWVIYNGNMDYLHCPDKLKSNNWNSCRGK